MSEQGPESTSPNRYGSVDPAISAWVHRNSLQLFNRYKDYEVRTVDLFRSRKWFRARPPFQIWVDAPDADGFVVVHAWDRQDLKFDQRCPVESVSEALDAALAWVQSQP